MDYVRLYLDFIKIRSQAQMENRTAFFLSSIAKIMGFGAEALIIWVMINQFKTIAGWSAYEVMFLFSLNLTTYSLAAFFFFHPFTKLPFRVQTGEFDEILTKPLNPLMYLVCREVSSGYFGNLVVSISVGIFCIIKLGILITLVNILVLILALLGGTLIQGAIFIFAFVPSFWLIQNNSLSNILMDIKGFIRFPISIYDRGIQILLTLVLPYAFINFYPAQYFLKKNDCLMFHSVFRYLSIFVGIIVFTGAYFFWKIALKHYKSTGS